MTTALPQLARELKTTDRTLRRALRDGLVRARRPSPRRVEMPLAERAYLQQAWPLLTELRAALRTEPSIRLAVLFGSRARGDHHQRSDLDILVQTKPGASVAEIEGRLLQRLRIPVHLVDLRDAEAAPLLLAEVLREGRVLIDRDRRWPALQRKRKRVEAAAQGERDRIDADFEALLNGRDAA